MFDKKSLYVLNKKEPEAIIYQDATGAIIRLTKEQFTSEEEFLRFKCWSDEDYHLEDMRDSKFHKVTGNIDDISDEACATDTLENDYQRLLDECEAMNQAELIADIIAHELTEKQRTYLCLYYMDNKKLREIAELYGSQAQVVGRIIDQAKKKIRKKLKIVV